MITMDNRSKAKRSHTMRAVRSKDTAPEMVVRRALYRQGYRYRLHRKDLPGKPDLAFISRKKAIFVHGCFWHAHGCRYGQPPKSNLEFWLPKLARNAERDQESYKALASMGWKTLVIWECQIKRGEDVGRIAVDFLEG